MKVARSAVLATAVAAMMSVSACTKVEGTGTPSSQSTTSETSSTSQESTPTSTSETSSSSSSSSESSSSSDSSSSSPFDTGSGQSGLVRAKVGEEGKTNDMSVKISKVVDPVPKGDNSFMTPKAGNRWVAVNMSVTNTASKPLSFSPMFCADAKTDKNQTVQDSLFSGYGTQFNSGDLQQGDTPVGDITFDVPDGQKLKQVDVKCSLNFGGDQRTIRFDVAN